MGVAPPSPPGEILLAPCAFSEKVCCPAQVGEHLVRLIGPVNLRADILGQCSGFPQSENRIVRSARRADGHRRAVDCRQRWSAGSAEYPQVGWLAAIPAVVRHDLDGIKANLGNQAKGAREAVAVQGSSREGNRWYGNLLASPTILVQVPWRSKLAPGG
jgi:hypothetical protein